MLDTIWQWLNEPTVYIAIFALSGFIAFKSLISFGIYLFKKNIIEPDLKKQAEKANSKDLS